METEAYKIFYAGIDTGGYPKEGQKLKKTGLPVTELARSFSFFLGKGKRAAKMRIYYAILPEYSGKTFFSGKPKGWKDETAKRLLGEARQRAAAKWDCREEIFSPQILSGSERIPLELMAVGLYCCRPFDRLCLSFPEDAGEQYAQWTGELLAPYLPRMRQVMLKGRECAASRMLEEYFYMEYGIVMTGIGKAPPDLLWLDWETDGTAPGTMKDCRHVNQAGMLKFLDTAVKNGYNTDVNSHRQ